MSDTTKTKQGDTLRTQNNVEETPKSNSLIEREEIPNTPFKLIHLQDKWFMVLGDHRLSQLYDTKEEVLDYFKTHMWETIIHIVIIIADEKKLWQELEKITTENT